MVSDIVTDSTSAVRARRRFLELIRMDIEHSLDGGTESSGMTSPTAEFGTAGAQEDTDRALIARWQAGDDDAFGVLFARHEGAVRRVCAPKLRNRDLVDEVVQRTFMRLLSKREAFQGGERVLHYLRRTARFVAVDVLNEQRQLYRTNRVPQYLRDESAGGDFEHVTERRLSAAAVLDGLPESDRQLLHARYLEDRPVAEIAHARNVTVGSCHTMLTRSRRRAADRARSLGIRSLVPVGLFGQLREWLNRTMATSPQVVVAAGFVVAVAAGLSAAESADYAPTSDSSVRRVATAPQAAARLGPTPAATHSKGPTPTDRRPAAGATGSAGTPPVDTEVTNRLLPFDEVAVPATDTTVHQEPPQDPDHTYTISTPTDLGPDIGYKSNDEPAEEPVHDAACQRLTTIPIVTCTVNE